MTQIGVDKINTDNTADKKKEIFIEENLLGTYRPETFGIFLSFFLKQSPFFIGFTALIISGVLLYFRPLQFISEWLQVGLIMIIFFISVILIGLFLYNVSEFLKTIKKAKYLRVYFYTTYMDYINIDEALKKHTERIHYNEINETIVKKEIEAQGIVNNILTFSYDSLPKKTKQLYYVKNIDLYSSLLHDRLEFVKQIDLVEKQEDIDSTNKSINDEGINDSKKDDDNKDKKEVVNNKETSKQDSIFY